MSQEIGGDDNGVRPNTASVPSLALTRKRLRDMEESSNNAHPSHENGLGNKNASVSAEFVVDLELADRVEVSPNKKRRGVVRGKRTGKNDTAGPCLQTLEGVEATEKSAGSEGESHKGIDSAPSHPMNSDSEQTSQNDGSANEYSKKLSTSNPPSNASGRQWRVSAWEDRMSELADFREKHGHCNVPYNYCENSKLATWAATQKIHYRLHQEGKTSNMTTFRIQELESLGFDWDRSSGSAWEDRLSELADYCKIYGHCNVPKRDNKNTKLGKWVATQRTHYRLHLEGKKSAMTTFRIQELESMGFEWGSHIVAWEDRLSELADYCNSHGHCKVPHNYSENSKLANWVGTQRTQYRFHLEGKKSQITPARIQALESLGFEWGVGLTAWEDRLSELADYCKLHRHCNVPRNSTKLGSWVRTQRNQYKLHQEGKTSSITPFRIQELESLGFEWDSFGTAWERRISELVGYRKEHGHCIVPRNYSENTTLANWAQKQRSQYRLYQEGKSSQITPTRIKELESLGFDWKPFIRGKGTPNKPTKPANLKQSASSQLETPNVILRATGYY
jgi:hypothetical protein